MAENSDTLDILSRPGGNDQVINKKVLLAALASAEAARLGITPNAEFVGMIESNFLTANGILDTDTLTRWLCDAQLSYADFQRVMCDFAAVVAVESQLFDGLTSRIDLHRRVMSVRDYQAVPVAAST